MKKSGCQGFCAKSPSVKIKKNDKIIQYVRVQSSDVKEIIEKTVLGDEIIERLLYKDGDKSIAERDDIHFYKAQTRRLLHKVGMHHVDYIHDYIANEGFFAFEKALFEMSGDQIVAEIEKSGLRGRGGGGFPTGFKWRTVYNQAEKTKYIVCNGDEGDPGAFLDGAIMEGAPFCMMEGMMIAAVATGAQEGYVYVREEYPNSITRLSKAVKSMEEAGLLGDNILGSGFSFRIHIHAGAGAFVCGDETALVNSLEGKRGMPRLKPPFLASKGLWDKPTLVNNVETFVSVPDIILKGADWYREVGTESCPGTKIFSLSGAVKHVGLVEVPMGTTLREIIFDICGGMKEGSTFKAVLVGGPTGRCLTEKALDIPFDFDTAKANDAIVGSGGIVVLDQHTNMVDVARFLIKYSVNESCGKCTPCRVGTTRMLEILTNLREGNGKLEDLDTLVELGEFIKNRAFCGLGMTAPLMTLSTLEDFRDEYLALIK